MITDIPEATGDLAIKTLAMPAHTNPNGDIFGGWIVSQMDLASGILAKASTSSRVVTVAIDSMVFHSPVKIGDLVCCYVDLLKIGRTSMTIKVEAWVVKHETQTYHRVTEGLFTYVAIDEEGRPTPVRAEESPRIFRNPGK